MKENFDEVFSSIGKKRNHQIITYVRKIKEKVGNIRKVRTCIETTRVGIEADHLLDLINTTEEEVLVGTEYLTTAKARRVDIPRGKAEVGVVKERVVKARKVSTNTRNISIRK